MLVGKFGNLTISIFQHWSDVTCRMQGSVLGAVQFNLVL